jgi:hypothetical protein
MSSDFVLLANGTPFHKAVDKCGQTQPPEVSFYNGLGVKASEMA